MITQKELKNKFTYDQQSGLFNRDKCFHSRYINAKVGCLDKDGYLVINISGKLYKAHRLAWLYMTGEFPSSCIDHIDRNKINNSWSNLRVVSMSVNKQNMVAPTRKNKTGYLGVSFYKITNKYVAGIKLNGKRKTIGYYSTPKLAHEAYLKAKKEMHV